MLGCQLYLYPSIALSALGAYEVLEALCNERKKSLRASFVSVGDNGHSDTVVNGKEDEMRLAETIVSGTSD